MTLYPNPASRKEGENLSCVHPETWERQLLVQINAPFPSGSINTVKQELSLSQWKWRTCLEAWMALGVFCEIKVRCCKVATLLNSLRKSSNNDCVNFFLITCVLEKSQIASQCQETCALTPSLLKTVETQLVGVSGYEKFLENWKKVSLLGRGCHS